MGSVRIPQAQLSEIQQPKGRKDQSELILQVLGNNPLAQGIQSAGTDIVDALAKRAEMRRQTEEYAKQINSLESLGGEQPGAYANLPPQMASSFAMASLKRREDLAKQQADSYSPEQLKAIETAQSISALAPTFGPKGVPQNALSLFSTIQNRKSLDADRDENRRLREMQEGTRVGEREKSRYRNYILDMEQRDPVIKELNKQKIGLDSVDSLIGLIRTGNTIASNALGAKVARSMGEVGVMTDTDVVRYVQSGKLTQGAADKLLRMIKGVPTEATIGEIEQITNALKDSFETKVQPRYDQYIDSYSSIEGISPDEFSNRTKIRYSGKKSAESGQKKATMRWNPATGKVEPI